MVHMALGDVGIVQAEPEEPGDIALREAKKAIPLPSLAVVRRK
jgi:hypothetical protein